MSDAHVITTVVASIAALAVGPVLFVLSRGRDSLLAGLRGFVQVAVVGMVLLEVMPTAVGVAGPMAIGLVAVGYLLPGLMTRVTGRADANWTQLLVVFGLCVHALVDGLALTGAHVGHHAGHGAGHGLEAAIVLHRLPVGLAVFWMLQARGRLISGLALASLGVATALGGWLGMSVVALVGDTGEAMLGALVGGLLMHVIKGESLAERGTRRHAGIGAVLGVASVVAILVPGGSHAGDTVRHEIIDTFTSLFVESAPALLLAYVLAGALGGAIGEASMRWLRRGGSSVRAMKGVAFGLPLPLCSCGVVPVYQSLIRRGTPAAAAVSFLVATPELGIDAVLISLPMLGPEIAVARVIAAAVVAMVVGYWVGGWIDARTPRPDVTASPGTAATRAPLSQRIRAGLRTGFVDIVDDSATWILLGLAIAALLSPFLRPEAFAGIPPLVQVPLFAVLGAPIYVCATGATPLAAILIAKGASPGAALAFLLTGPATNATTFGVLERLHGRRAALMFMGAVVVAVVGFGVLTDVVLDGAVEPVLDGAAHTHGPSVWEWISAGALTVLFAGSLIRQGPGGFIGQLGKLAQRGGHDHDHDHDGEGPTGAGEDGAASSCCGGK